MHRTLVIPTPDRSRVKGSKLPPEDKRMITAREIILAHCLGIIAQLKNGVEKPRYVFTPERVESAIKRLSIKEIEQLADHLHMIEIRSAGEYGPAAEAAKARLLEAGIGSP